MIYGTPKTDQVVEIYSIYDGDTGRTWTDLGYRARMLTKYRLIDLDCPEMHPRLAGRTVEGLENEREAARQALALSGLFLHSIEMDSVVWQHSYGEDPDEFGRWLVRFERVWPGGLTDDLHDILLEAGLAVPSIGGKTKWYTVKGMI